MNFGGLSTDYPPVKEDRCGECARFVPEWDDCTTHQIKTHSNAYAGRTFRPRYQGAKD